MQQFKNYLMDMDGVLVRGSAAVPGADAVIRWFNERNVPYLVLTNNPLYTPRDLSHRLHAAGLSVPAERIFTSAIATARFLKKQRPNGKAFVIGESGLTSAMHEAGYILTDLEPDYVVLGETQGYNLRRSRGRSAWWRRGRASSPPTPTPPARETAVSSRRAARWPR
jgi:NagD protein